MLFFYEIVEVVSVFRVSFELVLIGYLVKKLDLIIRLGSKRSADSSILILLNSMKLIASK